MTHTKHPHPAAHAHAHGPIRLVAIDLDGTLLRSDKGVTRTTTETIAACVKKGIHVVLASARPPRSVKSIHKLLKLDTLSVHYNGALIHDLSRARHVVHTPMEPSLVRQITTAARKFDKHCLVSLEILDRWYTDKHPRDTALKLETASMFEPDFIAPLDAFLTVPVTKLMLLAPPRRMLKLQQMLYKKFRGKAAMAVSDDHLLQFMHHEVDKSVALAHVAKTYGVDRKHVMAIGDAPNDAGMIRWAGMGVAVANAWPQVRQIAKAVVSSNDDNGVAEALRKFVLDAA